MDFFKDINLLYTTGLFVSAIIGGMIVVWRVLPATCLSVAKQKKLDAETQVTLASGWQTYVNKLMEELDTEKKIRQTLESKIYQLELRTSHLEAENLELSAKLHLVLNDGENYQLES